MQTDYSFFKACVKTSTENVKAILIVRLQEAGFIFEDEAAFLNFCEAKLTRSNSTEDGGYKILLNDEVILEVIERIYWTENSCNIIHKIQ